MCPRLGGTPFLTNFGSILGQGVFNDHFWVCGWLWVNYGFGGHFNLLFWCLVHFGFISGLGVIYDQFWVCGSLRVNFGFGGHFESIWVPGLFWAHCGSGGHFESISTLGVHLWFGSARAGDKKDPWVKDDQEYAIQNYKLIEFCLINSNCPYKFELSL